MTKIPTVLFDARWMGSHGIGRFASEVHARLGLPMRDIKGAHPTSARGVAELGVKARRARTGLGPSVFFSPGYCPPIPPVPPAVITVHDLIHLDVPLEASRGRTLYYDRIVRPALRTMPLTLTVSHFSKQRLVEWSGVSADRILVVGNGVDASFAPDGQAHVAGFPYVLSVGNTKAHKNLPRLIRAVATLPDVHLMLSGIADPALIEQARAHGMSERLHFAGKIAEAELPSYYRGALAVAIPSLYEGFGLPALEAMACGIPVVAGNAASLPEVVGDAGILVDPLDSESIAAGLVTAISDETARATARVLGPQRAQSYDWDIVSERVRSALLQI